MYLSIVPYHLVLLCSCTYHLVMQVTIQEIFDISIWYSVHLHLNSTNRCADSDVPSTKLQCRNLLNCDLHYKVVGTAKEQYKVVGCYVMVL